MNAYQGMWRIRKHDISFTALFVVMLSIFGHILNLIFPSTRCAIFSCQA